MPPSIPLRLGILRYVLLLLVFHSINTTAQSSFTLLDSPGYKAGRPCMRNCIYYMAQNNGCDGTNLCICRADIQPQITDYLSSCISKDCSYTVDINSGISVYQSYCSGKVEDATPVVVPVKTEIVETTVYEVMTEELISTITRTNRFTETVDETATNTATDFATMTVDGQTTLTRVVSTVTTQVPSSVTMIVYETYSTIIDSADSLQRAVEQWGFSSNKGLGTAGKVAIVMGVVAGVALIAFMVALCCCLSRRSELKKRTEYYSGRPEMGGTQGWRI